MTHRFADLTTLGIGGSIADYVHVGREAELIEAVRSADEAGQTLLVLGGGSNLVAGDAPFDGRVVHTATDDLVAETHQNGTTSVHSGPAPLRLMDAVPTDGVCGGVTVTVFAGSRWDRFVAEAIESDLMGIEALSGIPGTVGATPVQNVGAYGQDVSETIASVRTWDRDEGAMRTFPVADAGFGYRTSRFKRTPSAKHPGPTGRYVILSVSFQFWQGSLSAPIRYGELASRLGVEIGDRAPMSAVRAAVLQLRAGKGMVLDPADADTRSAGSFFTNPILEASVAAGLPADAPRYPAGQDDEGRELVKTSAAWLISHAGIERGFAVTPSARAAVSSKHSLALTNRGGASSEDVVQLAHAVQDRVHARFGIHLEPEPVRLGVDLR